MPQHTKHGGQACSGPGHEPREGGSAEGWARGQKSHTGRREASRVWQVGRSHGECWQQETTLAGAPGLCSFSCLLGYESWLALKLAALPTTRHPRVGSPLWKGRLSELFGK